MAGMKYDLAPLAGQVAKNQCGRISDTFEIENRRGQKVKVTVIAERVTEDKVIDAMQKMATK